VNRPLLAIGLLVMLFAHVANAQWVDIYSTKQGVSDSPAGPLLMNKSCLPEPVDRPLNLQDILLQAICANPQARQAWANVRAQAADVGVKEAAYLPTLDATAGIERDTLATTYNASSLGAGSISSSQNSSSRYGELDLAWVLFDFGKRSADLRQARQLLAAANATQDDTLQTIFFRAAQAYYDLSDAQASLEAAKAAESTAHDSLVDTTAKHGGGVGTLSDQLQAETTYRRAVLDRVSAEGDVAAATGALASMMGFAANTPVTISASDPTVDNAAFAQNVDQLINEAETQHPKLVAAHARLEAARANVDAVRAEGRPTISLVGNLTQNNPAYQQQPEQLPITGSRGRKISS